MLITGTVYRCDSGVWVCTCTYGNQHVGELNASVYVYKRSLLHLAALDTCVYIVLCNKWVVLAQLAYVYWHHFVLLLLVSIVTCLLGYYLILFAERKYVYFFWPRNTIHPLSKFIRSISARVLKCYTGIIVKQVSYWWQTCSWILKLKGIFKSLF